VAGYALRQPAGTAAPELPQPPLRFLSTPQFKVVEAMAERIFPADADGPGAKEARVASYIDGQLAGGWGRGEKMYRQGPFLTPTDSGHGWQFAMTPQDVYKDGLTSIDAYTDKQYSKPFHQLNTTQQDGVLKLMADGKIDTFTNVTSSQFFGTFRQNVVEGLFSDPSHGGNYKMIGWRWVGFPGSPMAHGNSYEKHIFKFERYPLEPKPLA
jgi:gluconate 2-dehydrogenase gamma chain